MSYDSDQNADEMFSKNIYIYLNNHQKPNNSPPKIIYIICWLSGQLDMVFSESKLYTIGERFGKWIAEFRAYLVKYADKDMLCAVGDSCFCGGNMRCLVICAQMRYSKRTG